ncbi:MAG: hypothetical protein HY326_03730, partial [Chloroflexi bacterium]|nr:hypothetical protein [Chloroflexota bacterium]
MNRQMKIGFLLLVILILVGCATTPTPAAVEKKEAAATSAPAAPTIAKPSAPAPTTAPASSQGQTSGQEERAAKQELVWTSSYSQRWDPARSSGFDFYAGNMYIFGTLLRFDEKGNLIPWLAESYEV